MNWTSGNIFVVKFKRQADYCLIVSNQICVFKNHIYYYEFCNGLRLYSRNIRFTNLKFVLDVKEII